MDHTPKVGAMDFYSAIGVPNSNLFIINRLTEWYKLPKGTNETVWVISVSEAASRYWIVAYTVLVALIFMAACELTTMMVLTFFTVGKSGTRQAILVAYYNAGRPSKIALLMLGYLRTTLWKCKRSEEHDRKVWSIDWSAAWASFCLFCIAFSLLSGDLITRFFLGGGSLIQANVAQANPEAIYYPDFESPQPDSVQRDMVFEALKGPGTVAVYQAIARRASTSPKNLQSRISFQSQQILNGTSLPGGAVQNGTGVHFTWQYNLTGYEMGLRDAPGLVLGFQGSCKSFHGETAVFYGKKNFTYGSSTYEPFDRYILYEDTEWGFNVPLERERYNAPWVRMMDNTGPEAFEESKKYGGWTFQLAPVTAWRATETEKRDDPWYETELDPTWVNETGQAYGAQYRVKSGRFPLRCTQNDTFTYNTVTVNHVEKLQELPGLKLSPLLRDMVFRREFGTPIMNRLLGYGQYAGLVSGAHYVSNQRRLEVSRANITEDIRGLVEMSFLYSREVIRNTALLFPSLERDSLQNANIATSGFLLESPEVVAMSVFVMVTTPSVCVFLWLLVFIWHSVYNPESKLDHTSAKGRHGLRYYSLQAVHLYRFLDEELSRKRKWSGRNTETPFIRDLDADKGTSAIPPFSEKMPYAPATPELSSPILPVSTTNQLPAPILPASATPSLPSPVAVEEASKFRVMADYAKPKLIRFDERGIPEQPSLSGQFVNWVRKVCGRTVDERQFEVAMTRAWNPDTPKVSWRNVREGL